MHVVDLEEYLFQRIGHLDGNLYYSLLPLAEALEKGGKPLSSSLIYMALIDSILTRALSQYYHHAVKYLKKRDRHACSVNLGLTATALHVVR